MKFYSKGIIILIVLVCVTGLAFVVKGCIDNPRAPDVPPRPDVTKYDILVEDWNRAVVNAKLNKFFYLPDTNPEGVISRLNAIIAPFYQCSDPGLKSELKKILDVKKHSFVSFYADFLNSHCVTTRLTFNSSQSSSEIRSLVGQITKQNRINTKMISIVASMNDPCFYINAYRNDLYEKGMSRNIESCEDLNISEKKYPFLFDLINKGKKGKAD